MSPLRGIDESGSLRWQPVAGGEARHEQRRLTRSGRLGTGTLACPRCDAPIALAGTTVTPADSLGCPFCDHTAPARDFLSLAAPPRATRVEVRVVARHSGW